MTCFRVLSTVLQILQALRCSLKYFIHFTYIHTYLGSHWYPPPFCVWCSPAKFLLCWTGHLSLVPHCIRHDTSCIQVSAEVTLMNKLSLPSFVDKGKARIQAIRYSYKSRAQTLPSQEEPSQIFCK